MHILFIRLGVAEQPVKVCPLDGGAILLSYGERLFNMSDHVDHMDC